MRGVSAACSVVRYKSLSEEKFESVMEGEADLEEIMTEEKKQEER